MKETIEKILSAENSAKERVEKAREEAKEIRLKVEKDAEEIIAKVRDDGHQAARVLLEKNEKDTLAEKERMLQEAAQSKDRGLTGNKEKVEDVLDGLLHIVLGKDISSK